MALKSNTIHFEGWRTTENITVGVYIRRVKWEVLISPNCGGIHCRRNGKCIDDGNNTDIPAPNKCIKYSPPDTKNTSLCASFSWRFTNVKLSSLVVIKLVSINNPIWHSETIKTWGFLFCVNKNYPLLIFNVTFLFRFLRLLIMPIVCRTRNRFTSSNFPIEFYFLCWIHVQNQKINFDNTLSN